MDCSLPGSSVYGLLQARILQVLSFPAQGDFLNPGIEPESLMSPASAGRFFTTVPPEKPQSDIWSNIIPDISVKYFFRLD